MTIEDFAKWLFMNDLCVKSINKDPKRDPNYPVEIVVANMKTGIILRNAGKTLTDAINRTKDRFNAKDEKDVTEHFVEQKRN